MTSIDLVTITTSDGKKYNVPKDVITKSVTVKNMLEDFDTLGQSGAPIPLPNVNSKIFEKVLEYCTYHHEHPEIKNKEQSNQMTGTKLELSEWEKEFVNVDNSILFEVILAANYLDIKPLLDMTCKTVALMIKGKSPEAIRQTFNIKNDFTPEEEEQVRKDNEWCEERA